VNTEIPGFVSRKQPCSYHHLLTNTYALLSAYYVIILHSVVHKCWLINGDKNIAHDTYDMMVTLVLLAFGFMKLEIHHTQT